MHESESVGHNTQGSCESVYNKLRLNAIWNFESLGLFFTNLAPQGASRIAE